MVEEAIGVSGGAGQGGEAIGVSGPLGVDVAGVADVVEVEMGPLVVLGVLGRVGGAEVVMVALGRTGGAAWGSCSPASGGWSVGGDGRWSSARVAMRVVTGVVSLPIS